MEEYTKVEIELVELSALDVISTSEGIKTPELP